VTLILASSSPRRIELLSRLTSDFIAVPSRVPEEATGRPEEQVLALARRKATEVAKAHRGVIIGADTIVTLDDEILGKPGSRAEAREILTKLSGRTHRVLTGLYVVSTFTGQSQEAYEETEVTFRGLSAAEIEWYLDSGEYADKAGAYAIQGKGVIFVEGICGDYFNVMGLPLCRLYLLLRDIGYKLPRPTADK